MIRIWAKLMQDLRVGLTGDGGMGVSPKGLPPAKGGRGIKVVPRARDGEDKKGVEIAI